MAKAYWIARVDVHDEEAYKGYVAANAAAFKKIWRENFWCAAPSRIRGSALRAGAMW